MMEFTTVANQSNVDEFVDILITGVKAANSYPSECFSTSDVAKARALNYVLDQLLERTEKAGYDQAVLKAGFDRHKWLVFGGNQVPGLKQVADESFLVDLSDFGQAMSYAFAIKKHEGTAECIVLNNSRL